VSRGLVIASIIFLISPYAGARVFSSVWLGGDGVWSNGHQWSTAPAFPINGRGFNYNATINSGNVTLDRPITIQNFFLTGGSLEGDFGLAVKKGLQWTGGTISGTLGSSLDLSKKANSTIGGAEFRPLTGRTINNAGRINQTQSMGGDNANANNLSRAIWSVEAGGNGSNDLFLSTALFNNAGNFIVTGGRADFTRVAVSGVFNNSGSVTIAANTLAGSKSFAIAGDGAASGNFIVASGTQLEFLSRPLVPNSYTLTNRATIAGAGSTFNETLLTVAGNNTINTNLTNQGTISINSGATLTLRGALNQLPLSAVQLAGGTVNTPTLAVGLGSLNGSGTVKGNATVFGGNIHPSVVPGIPIRTIAIGGNLTFDSDTHMIMDIGGLKQGADNSFVSVTGNVQLDGLLFLQMLGNFASQLDGNQTFTLLTANGSLSGAFQNVANGERLETFDGTASFQVNYGAGSPFGAQNLVLSDPMAITAAERLSIVPEPVSTMLFGVGVLLLFLVRNGRPRR
jgi:hypothetical protein